MQISRKRINRVRIVEIEIIANLGKKNEKTIPNSTLFYSSTSTSAENT
jgi:hypothetical protein